jgi:Mrp family chromosome partitioning ATPase/capsular polysaccharide biosynthesis protein
VDIRHYLNIARRQRWVIIEAVVVVALLAGVFSALQPSTYRATAKVILRADDLSEADSTAYYYDADRYVALQSDIVKSHAVLDAAAADLDIRDRGALARKVSVTQKAATDILEVSATDRRPEEARDIANAVANAYIDNRTDDALGNLEEVATQLDEQLAALRSQIGDYDARISQRAAEAAITGAAVRDDVLEAAREAASLQYQTVFGRQQELQVDIGLKRSGATLLAEAGTPRVPNGSGPLRSGVIGGVVGLLLGLGIALLREQLDDRAKSRAELEQATKLPVLAELPVDPPSAKGSFLATRDAPLSPLAEATRSLRTSLHFLGVDEPLRRIVVTSASPGEGKSVVAANIAVAYAQAGFRTVLVSADLRRPGVERLFDVPPNPRGLSDLIADVGVGLVRTAVAEGREAQGRNSSGDGRALAFAARPQDALLPTAEPNLRLLPAGSVPPNASELLASPHATEILDALGAEADVVVLDTPPTLPVTDAAVLAAKSDGVVLVAVPGETMRSAAARAHETLDTPQVRLLGLVLNKSREAGRSAYRYGNEAAGPATRRRRGSTLVRTGASDS